jgi:hypothetical protein
VLTLFLFAALLQPVFVYASFPLWTQDANGAFIVINPTTGAHQPAPFQFRPQAVLSPIAVRYFAYDPDDELIWVLFDLYPEIGPSVNPVRCLGSMDPRTGKSFFHIVLSDDKTSSIYSLTYRRSDGHLYAFMRWVGTPDLHFVIEIDPRNPLQGISIVCQVQPKQVEWNQQYTFNNQPPLNLVFNPRTDICYYESSLSGDGGVLFELDLAKGQSDVASGIGDSIALTFSPNGKQIYGIAFNAQSGPNTVFWEGRFPNTGSPSGSIFAHVATQPFSTSLTFVPQGHED